MKQIIIVKPKSISPKDKEKLSKNGFVVIECENENDVKLLCFCEGITNSSDMLMAAMAGVNEGDANGRRAFFLELYKRMKQNEQNKKPL